MLRAPGGGVFTPAILSRWEPQPACVRRGGAPSRGGSPCSKAPLVGCLGSSHRGYKLGFPGYKSGFPWGGGPLEAGPRKEEEGEPVEPPGAEGTFFARSGLKMLINFTKFYLKARAILQRSFHPKKLGAHPCSPACSPSEPCARGDCRKLAPGSWLWGWRRANARVKASEVLVFAFSRVLCF